MFHLFINIDIITTSKSVGSTALTGEKATGLKKSASRDKLCLCKRVQSRWTRQSNFAPTRRVPQEAKWGRAISVSMVANDHVTSARAVKRPLAQGKAPSLKDSVQRKRRSPWW